MAPPVRTSIKRKAQLAEASSEDDEFDGALLEGVLSEGEDADEDEEEEDLSAEDESFQEDEEEDDDDEEEDDDDDEEEDDDDDDDDDDQDIVNGDISSGDEGFAPPETGVRFSKKTSTASDSGVDTAGPAAMGGEAQTQTAEAEVGENQRPDFRVVTDANGGVRYEYPEIEPGYDSEDSDRGGDGENTIGNIPLSFYDAYPHLGYDINGHKVMRPATTEALDALLDSIETPAGFTGLVDPQTGKPLTLSRDELELLKKLQLNEIPEDMELYPDQIEWFSSRVMSHPLSSAPEPKRRFVPSKHEAKRVMKIVRAIREGRIVPHKPPEDEEEVNFDIWANEEARPPHVMNLVAPKLPPPGFEESYRPPKEYIPDDDEKAKWEQSEPEERERNFLPTSYSSLRLVPAYSSFIYERFQRSLDLYMAPRVARRKLRMDPQDLLPKLPRPEDLKPFPSLAQTIFNHGCRVRTVSFSPDGYFIATGADDGLARVWSINGHLEWSAKLSGEAAVDAVRWRPHKETFILAAAAGEDIFLVVPPCAGNTAEAASREALNAGFGHAVAQAETTATGARKEPAGRWHRPSARLQDQGVLLKVTLQSAVKTLSWHRRGEYLASVSPTGKRNAVAIHTLSKHQTQLPFRKIPGSAPQTARFHPSRPLFFVATQRAVRVYDLQRQELVKILQPGSRWISSFDVHPAGDNVIVGGYDRRLAWIDMDLSPRPYKTLRYHDKAIRATKFHHGGLPLFADCSDDGTIEVYHGRVVADLMANATLVPLKQLRGHKVVDSLGVMDVDFHPREAWIVSAGADGTVRLWCN